ncbi:MAG: serine protease [Deltaproteobacteria bacterium]|nr:serine protease [Deltaproteobacteria bacterium]MBW1962973.1 serine protease [Deltaproteobacteria bacterium]MBW1993297.1 serine protease [Deltaproteobacteria bacterium]MBW2153844.1 serine protease [Deltaproteobacteria bacterium]
MNDRLLLSTILQLVGVVVIIAEIILPSGGILSIVALGVFGYSLFIVFNEISKTIGFAFVAADLVMIPVLVIVGLKLMARSPVTLRKTLSRKEGVSSQSPKLDSYIDMPGTAITDLHPAGIAVINGKRVDVVTRGEYVQKDSAIIVTAVTGNQIIVRKKDTS